MHCCRTHADLKLKEYIKEGKMLEEELNTEGMDEAEASLLQRQREVAIKRVRTVNDKEQHSLIFG